MFFLKSLLKLGGSKAAAKFQDDEKPFLDHLEDLRGTLMKVVGTLIISTLLAFLFYKQLINIINYPVEQAGYDSQLLVLSPFEGFMSVLKVCLYSGLVCSFPLILYFIGEFVIPGLNDKEKKLIMPVIIASFLLFAAGVLFAYFVAIPRALNFFQHFNEGVEIQTELRFKYTVSFVTMLCLAFGLCFELPVVVMTLVKLELLNSKMMRDTRSYAIIAMFILAAIITPTPDIATMSLLAGPMILLYEICIWLAWGLERKSAKAEAREKEREHKALVESQKRAKKRADAEDADTTDEASSDDDTGSSSAPAGTLAYDPANEATFDDDNHGDEDQGSDTTDDVANDPSGDDPDAAAHDEYHSGMPGDDDHRDSSSDSVWNSNASHDDGGHDSTDHEDDPHHYDHHYHDDYYSGPTEELKRSLREELKVELKEDIKMELRNELKDELLEELRTELRKEFGDGERQKD